MGPRGARIRDDDMISLTVRPGLLYVLPTHGYSHPLLPASDTRGSHPQAAPSHSVSTRTTLPCRRLSGVSQVALRRLRWPEVGVIQRSANMLGGKSRRRTGTSWLHGRQKSTSAKRCLALNGGVTKMHNCMRQWRANGRRSMRYEWRISIRN